MQLKTIYKSNINRPINGVIQMAQNDEETIRQELSEYVITRELRKHFDTFFNNYEKSINTYTDKIGVWISGFFGSGKSHFLKMLSYLLSNKVVAGKSSVEYFADKFDDPMMYAQIERCVKVPTDTILFNIDAKSPINKDKTAILRVFAKVFYEHCGFYGNDLKIAKLEQFITKSGKMEQFKKEFALINGDEWERARDAFAFFEDDVVDALISTLGMSETAARNWFNGTETAEMSIEQLVCEIKEYIDSKGKDYRLLFMIDEVGQYIGSDSSLMLNLQTIVEEIGTKCGGRVWVMVTSQEAIDSITKISGDDFSKIQGRFNTRLSLSSSSVDEVIKKRILAKNEDAENMLKLSYAQNSAVMKNLFTFNGAVLDLKGYASEYDFVETYPFVPYQFRLLQNVFTQVRRHGNAGKHVANGERSMISGFQEAAQAIQEKDENALVPFSLFYDTLNTFLESAIRRVIDRCQNAADNGDGIEQYDVSILKLLYLIRYIDDVKANVENIATLMVEDIRADKITMRLKVQESLDRLVGQNYVARNGDTYTFLTDDEQDIARDIRRTDVDSAMIVQAISQSIFGSIYQSKKFRYENKYDFAFDQMVDETVVGQLTGAIRMRFVTVASDLYNASEQMLIMKSQHENSAIVVLSDKYPYFDELESAMKIRKYAKMRNTSELPEAIRRIISNRQQEASALEKRVEKNLADAILDAKIYVAGELMQSRHSSVKDKLDSAMSILVESVYTKLSYVKKTYDSDADILTILNTSKQVSMGVSISPNLEALEEIEQYLAIQSAKMLPTSMGDIQRRFSAIPYGWREVDIAALIATLIVDGKITVQYAGNIVRTDDRRITDYLRRRSEIDKAIVKRRVAISDSLMKKSREFLREYFNVMDIPADEDTLIAYVLDSFNSTKDKLQALLDSEYATQKYPERNVVENGIKLIDSVLSQRKDNTSLLTKMVNLQDELLDNAEDMQSVWAFFKNQKPIFDSAVKCVNKMMAERDYLQAEESAMRSIYEIQRIIDSAKPYKRISELPDLMQSVNIAYNALLDIKKNEIAAEIQAAMAEIHQSATRTEQREIVSKADNALAAKREAAKNAETMTELDAMKAQISNIRSQYLRALMVEDTTKDAKVATLSRGAVCHTAKLSSEAEIDDYLLRVKEKLLKELENNDTIHII